MSDNVVPIQSAPGQLKNIWFTRCPVPTASGIAHALGWLTEEFGKDGITIDAIQDAATDLSRHHFDHKLEGLFREGGNIPALTAKALGSPSRLIGLTWIDEWQAIVVRPDHANMVPHALRGMRVALPGYAPERGGSIARGMSLHGIKGALSVAGLSLEDVTFVEIPYRAVDNSSPEGLQRLWSGLEWLAEGRVDAVYAKGASAADAMHRLGLAVGIDLDAYPSRLTRVNNGTPRPITVHQDLIDNHFDYLVRFLAATLKAADWAASHVEEVRAILLDETQGTPASVIEAYGEDFQARLHPTLDQDRIDLFEQQKKFLLVHGFLDRDFSLSDWIDPAPIEAARALADRG